GQRALPGVPEAALLGLVLGGRRARPVGPEPGAQLGAEALLRRGVGDAEHPFAPSGVTPNPARTARNAAGPRAADSGRVGSGRRGERRRGEQIDRLAEGPEREQRDGPENSLKITY